MTRLLYPFADDKPFGNSDADRVELNLLLDAVRATKVYVAPPGRTADPHDGLATDTLVNLREWR